MSVKEYTLKFNQLPCYTPEMTGNMRAQIRKFASGLLDDLVLECKGTMLNRDMDFSRLSVHIQQVEKNKKRIIEYREKDRQEKTARTANQNHS